MKIADTHLQSRIRDVVSRVWGYSELRPLQEEAIACGLKRRDSLVVMPTGAGKSLCYQVPPLLEERTDVVVSPLISLMKDQVDGLLGFGYPAAAWHSGLDQSQRRDIFRQAEAGAYRLLFVSPEGLFSQAVTRLLERLQIGSFAVDEAHCISHWGHDFRPEYRRLALLKEKFPQATLHAYTATATPRVREDIVAQLKLESPTLLIGGFDRPNLIYRILPRTDPQAQVLRVVRRYPNEAVIVYCISRKDAEELAGFLQSRNVRAGHYHAGMDGRRRTSVQDAFSREELDVVVATVAFGMGIDRSNVRCVVHAAMPKSIEHYQQETGRAGRDGLPAECVLLYSGQDLRRWQFLLERKSEGETGERADASLQLLYQMQGYCRSLECRHRALARYFGQSYDALSCQACDVCLGEVDALPESTEEAQKILSCVYRLGQRFGVAYVAEILAGSDSGLVQQRGHDRLSTHGLMRRFPRKTIQNLIFQLVDQGLLDRTPGDRPVLQLNQESTRVLRGERPVFLRQPAVAKVRKTALERHEWEGVDQELFQRLRRLRRELSQARGVPAYTVFGDAVLRDMARRLPTTGPEMLRISGVGRVKLRDFGPLFLDVIRAHVKQKREGSGGKDNSGEPPGGLSGPHTPFQ